MPRNSSNNRSNNSGSSNSNNSSNRSERSSSNRSEQPMMSAWRDTAKERPLAAAAAVAGAVGAGVFLWSRRNQISDQISNLSEQITDWAGNMQSGSGSSDYEMAGGMNQADDMTSMGSGSTGSSGRSGRGGGSRATGGSGGGQSMTGGGTGSSGTAI